MSPPILREWQTEAVERIRACFRAGHRNVLLVAPTGSGKTVIASYLVSETDHNGKRAVFVCDRIPLIEQTSATFDRYKIDHGVIQAAHWRDRSWKRIQVASAQTLARRKWPDADLIINDEAHTVHKSVATRTDRRDCYTVGLTATPFTRGLAKHYDAVVTVRTLDQLTAEGLLAPFKVFAPSQPDMTGAKVTKLGEWEDADTAKRAMPIVGDIVTEYLKHGEGRHFIAFGVNVAHCEEIQHQLMAAGIMAGLYTYQTSDEKRAEMLRDFQPGGHLRGLVSVAALSKGFDAPHVGVIIMARPLRKSLAEHIQILGRGLRIDPANPDKVCLVLDHAGNMMRFGEKMYEFFAEGVSTLDDGKTKEKKPQEKPELQPYKCPKCTAVHRPAPMCPACGHEYPKKAAVRHVSGELREMGAPERGGDGRQAFYSELLGVCHQRGYKPGWAFHKYAEKFGGRTPRQDRLQDVPTTPSRATESWVRSRMIAWAKGKDKGDAGSAAA
jgi:DNA repair protein RadD